MKASTDPPGGLPNKLR
jgi:hypothetical protein